MYQQTRLKYQPMRFVPRKRRFYVENGILGGGNAIEKGEFGIPKLNIN